MIDTLIAGKLDRFNYNLYMLHKTVELTKPVLEGMKNAMAVQWFLGNIIIIVLFSLTIIYLVLQYKKIKKIMPSYKVPKRFFILYSSLFFLAMIGFNCLPNMSMEQIQMESTESNK